MESSDILHFWFVELTPAQWFGKSDELDQTIRKRFSQIHEKASNGELAWWRTSAKGRLAEIIVLDQFSRNIYRDDKRAFTQDALALILAQEMVIMKLDGELTPDERTFAYMPFMHSESLSVHEIAEKLFSMNGISENLDYEIRHKKIIERFGRYPHRNNILGRTSTQEELQFLQQKDSSF